MFPEYRFLEERQSIHMWPVNTEWRSHKFHQLKQANIRDTKTQTWTLIYIYMSQEWKWVRKQNNNITYFWLKWLIGMDAGRYADTCRRIVCACAVVFPPKWLSRLSWHHLTMSQKWLMHKREGIIKEGVRLLLRFIWVFRHTLEGLHLSHRPSTSAVSVPLM